MTINHPLPSLRHLSHLIALHDTGHFGRAAQARFVTQSTLSAAIAELESQLGITLVERTTRKVRFTEAGEAIVAQARRVTDEAERLVGLARAAQAPLSSRLRLAIIPTIAPFLLARLVSLIRREWPQLDLQVRELMTPSACGGLERGTVDCALLAMPVECGDVETIDLGTDRLLLALRATEVAAGTTSLPSSCLERADLLLLEDGHCLKDHALSACRRWGGGREPLLLASTLPTLVVMVASGLGMTLVPEMAVKAGLLNGSGVTALPMADATAERRVALAWRRGDPNGRDFRLLAETIQPLFVTNPNPPGSPA